MEESSHASQYQLANQLGRQSADINEAHQQGFDMKKLAFKTLSRQETTSRDADLKTDAEKDLASVPKIYKTGKALSQAGYRTIAVAAPARIGGKGAVGAGFRAGKGVLTEAGEGSKVFGKGAVAAKDIGGVEGIVGNVLSTASGGGAGAEVFSKIGAKSVTALGAGIAVGSDIVNAFETGNIFDYRDSATGKVVKQSLGVDVGNIGTILAGGLDILAAFTGGALAPLAAAANIAIATESTIAGIKQDAAQKKEDEGEGPPTHAPPVVAPPAFAQYGILANQSHDPLKFISN